MRPRSVEQRALARAPHRFEIRIPPNFAGMTLGVRG